MIARWQFDYHHARDRAFYSRNRVWRQIVLRAGVPKLNLDTGKHSVPNVMSEKLTDVLIDIADPVRLRCYRENPEEFMHEAGLTEEEKAALRAGDASRIRLHAIAEGSEAADNQQYRHFTTSWMSRMSRTSRKSSNAGIIEVAFPEVVAEIAENVVSPLEAEVDVHIGLENNNDQVASPEDSLVFVDKHGKLFKAVPRA